MIRLVLLIGTVLLLSGAVNASRDDAATAQEAMAAHPIVGGWRCANDNPGGSFVSFALFHPDGAYVEEVFYGVTLLGVGQATGERTADLNLFASDADPDPDAVLMGEGHFAIEVDESGDGFDLEGAFAGQSPDGSVLVLDEGLMSRCTRLEVRPPRSVGTPALPPDMSGEATPTP
jgi:hypothetical protein